MNMLGQKKGYFSQEYMNALYGLILHWLQFYTSWTCEQYWVFFPCGSDASDL